jgi:archaellum component FlaC
MVRILPSFVVLFATRQPLSHTTCISQNQHRVSTLRMSTNGNPMSREDAIGAAIVVGSMFAAWTVNSLTNGAMPTSVLVPGVASQESSAELQSTTAEILQSAVALRVSVEERQLSMVMNDKAYSHQELEKQLDEHQKSYDELWKEVNKLDALEKKVESSMLFYENLMREPNISQSEARTLQQKCDELKEMKTKVSEKSMAAFRQTKQLRAEMDMLELLQQQDPDHKD